MRPQLLAALLIPLLNTHAIADSHDDFLHDIQSYLASPDPDLRALAAGLILDAGADTPTLNLASHTLAHETHLHTASLLAQALYQHEPSSLLDTLRTANLNHNHIPPYAIALASPNSPKLLLDLLLHSDELDLPHLQPAISYAGPLLLPQLHTLLAHELHEHRRRALLALQWLRTLARDSSNLTLLAARDPNPEVRGQALLTLADSSPQHPSTLLAISSALHDPQLLVRLLALKATTLLGPSAATLVTQLSTLLDDDELTLPTLETLALIGDPARSSIPHIIPLLLLPHSQLPAARALALIGPGRDDVSAAITSAFSLNPHPQHPHLDAHANCGQPQPHTLQRLRTLLPTHPHIPNALSQLPHHSQLFRGSSPKTWLALLDDPQLHDSALLSLQHLQDPSLLASALQHELSSTRRLIPQLLALTHSPKTPFLLASALLDEDPLVVSAAARALRSLQTPPSHTIPTLLLTASQAHPILRDELLATAITIARKPQQLLALLDALPARPRPLTQLAISQNTSLLTQSLILRRHAQPELPTPPALLPLLPTP